MDRTTYDAPTCAGCGAEVDASRTEYRTDSASPVMVETSEPCGCVARFPLPTRDNNTAAAEIMAMERASAARLPREYVVLAVIAGAITAFYVGLALARDDLGYLGAAVLGAVLVGQNWKAARWQRTYRSALDRLSAE